MFIGSEYYKTIGEVIKVNQHSNAYAGDTLLTDGYQLDQKISYEKVLPPNIFLKKRKLIIDHDKANINSLKGMCIPASKYDGKESQ